jgi:hypothetical protein
VLPQSIYVHLSAARNTKKVLFPSALLVDKVLINSAKALASQGEAYDTDNIVSENVDLEKNFI